MLVTFLHIVGSTHVLNLQFPVRPSFDILSYCSVFPVPTYFTLHSLKIFLSILHLKLQDSKACVYMSWCQVPVQAALFLITEHLVTGLSSQAGLLQEHKAMRN